MIESVFMRDEGWVGALGCLLCCVGVMFGF